MSSRDDIRVQLSFINSPIFEKRWMLINAKSVPNIKYFVQEIKQRNSLDYNIELFLLGASLPTWEKSAILRDGDVVEVKCCVASSSEKNLAIPDEDEESVKSHDVPEDYRRPSEVDNIDTVNTVDYDGSYKVKSKKKKHKSRKHQTVTTNENDSIKEKVDVSSIRSSPYSRDNVVDDITGATKEDSDNETKLQSNENDEPVVDRDNLGVKPKRKRKRTKNARKFVDASNVIYGRKKPLALSYFIEQAKLVDIKNDTRLDRETNAREGCQSKNETNDETVWRKDAKSCKGKPRGDTKHIYFSESDDDEDMETVSRGLEEGVSTNLTIFDGFSEKKGEYMSDVKSYEGIAKDSSFVPRSVRRNDNTDFRRSDNADFQRNNIKADFLTQGRSDISVAAHRESTEICKRPQLLDSEPENSEDLIRISLQDTNALRQSTEGSRAFNISSHADGGDRTASYFANDMELSLKDGSSLPNPNVEDVSVNVNSDDISDFVETFRPSAWRERPSPSATRSATKGHRSVDAREDQRHQQLGCERSTDESVLSTGAKVYRRRFRPSQQTLSIEILNMEGETSQVNPETLKKRDYLSLPDLNGPPSIGSVVAYKICEMQPDYTPDISDYKEGTVIQYDERTGMVTLQPSQQSQAPTKGSSGKFDVVLLDGDSVELTNNPQLITGQVSVHIDHMMDAKLVSCQSSTS